MIHKGQLLPTVYGALQTYGMNLIIPHGPRTVLIIEKCTGKHEEQSEKWAQGVSCCGRKWGKQSTP